MIVHRSILRFRIQNDRSLAFDSIKPGLVMGDFCFKMWCWFGLFRAPFRNDSKFDRHIEIYKTTWNM